MIINILNEPPEAKDFEFIVVKPLDEKTGEYLFEGMFENEYFADQTAHKVGGIVIHNVHIVGRREPEKEKYYTFIGTWTWGIMATSKKEAIKKFEDAYIEDYDIGDYDHIEEEDID